MNGMKKDFQPRIFTKILVVDIFCYALCQRVTKPWHQSPLNYFWGVQLNAEMAKMLEHQCEPPISNAKLRSISFHLFSQLNSVKFHSQATASKSQFCRIPLSPLDPATLAAFYDSFHNQELVQADHIPLLPGTSPQTASTVDPIIMIGSPTPQSLCYTFNSNYRQAH